MLDELSSLFPWANHWRRDGYRRARLQAITRHSASVVIVVDCVRSNRTISHVGSGPEADL